jgi:hypothetical protein
LINREELAWAAGFFDGEGNIRVAIVKYKYKNYYKPVLQIAQVEVENLYRFNKAIQYLGNITGPYGKQWKLVINNFECMQATIAMMWEWLGDVKREQAIQTLNRTRYTGLGRLGR